MKMPRNSSGEASKLPLVPKSNPSSLFQNELKQSCTKSLSPFSSIESNGMQAETMTKKFSVGVASKTSLAPKSMLHQYFRMKV